MGGDNSVVFYYLSASEIWPDERVVSLERDNLILFYYLSASEIWSDKRGYLVREGLLHVIHSEEALNSTVVNNFHCINVLRK